MRLAAAALLFALAACQTAAPTQTGPGLSVTLRPVRSGGTEVVAINVREAITGPAGKAFGLVFPVTYPGSGMTADRLQGLKATDAQGEIVLVAKDDPAVPGGFPYLRHWTATRPVSWPVTLTYRALVQPVGGANGPPFGIRPSAGGVSGAGATFIVSPEGLGAMPAHLAWDLSDMPAGSFGVASFGEGAAAVKSSEALLQAWYLAGPAQRYPASGQADGFSAAWLGQFSFDAAAEMKWAGGMYTYLGKAFGYLDPKPSYRVFMRYLDTPPIGGGTALAGSFMLSTGVGGRAESPRVTVTHEMIHQWTGGIEGPNGVTSWFSEGLTTYYTMLMPTEGGFFTPQEQASQIAAITDGYWGSPARLWSAVKIAEAGFGDESVRHVPYNRSALYFADLDAQIRAKSGGKRRLMDMLQPMFRSRQAGTPFTQDAWIAMVTKEIGPGAADTFRSVILEGAPFAPAAGAFGPCHERRSKTYEVKGERIEGFEWVRNASIPDATCRAW